MFFYRTDYPLRQWMRYCHSEDPKVELLVLIDRRFNRELPIQPDFTGRVVDTIEQVDVEVRWAATETAQNEVVFVR